MSSRIFQNWLKKRRKNAINKTLGSLKNSRDQQFFLLLTDVGRFPPEQCRCLSLRDHEKKKALANTSMKSIVLDQCAFLEVGGGGLHLIILVVANAFLFSWSHGEWRRHCSGGNVPISVQSKKKCSDKDFELRSSVCLFEEENCVFNLRLTEHFT